MSLPLSNIRVLDFGRYIAGPYAAMMLADFGADVIRIERRDGGEDRTLGPVTDSGEGGLFLNLNRNKRGMTLDPGHARAGEVLAPLVKSADIVVANLPVGVLLKIGLDYDSLRAIKPDIILVMPSAFGPDGPYRDRIGFDGVAQAMSGAMTLTGLPEMPMRSVVSWVDYGTALHAAFGAMAALLHRQQTGEGQAVDVSLLTTSATFMTPFLMERQLTGTQRQGQGNAAFYTAPSDAYQTRDGWILVPTIGNPMFRRWARLVGREDLIDDPRCRDDIARGDNYHLIGEAMNAWCSTRTSAEALAELEAARVPCGPVNDLDELLADPQVQARGIFEDVAFAGHSTPLPLAGPPVRLSASPGSVRRPPPRLSEHTDEVLGELGFDADAVAMLRTEGVV
ncbi:MAG: CoA transferase [Planctomycetota bacterium]|nr:MAG: CoA transferase [Planctomycetota bacterium]